MQFQFVLLGRLSQSSLENKALDRLCLDIGGEEPEIVLALFLGQIHCDVGVLRQREGVVPVLGENRNADAGRGAAVVTRNRKWRRQVGKYLACDDLNVRP